MSEKLSHTSPESNNETIDLSAETRRNHERLQKAAENEADLGQNIEQLKVQADRESISGKETTVGEKQEDSKSPIGIQKQLKETAYRQSIQRIQSHLKGPARLLSQVVHKPAIERLSNIGARTVARPSGILGGGFAALFGSNILLYFAKRYGFEYNYFAFFIFFLGGFIVGLLLEGFLKLIHKKTAKS